jgi:hypothetical protein
MESKFYTKLLLFFGFVIFMITSPLAAQTFGIKGRIVDSESQEFLDEATVTLRGTVFGKRTAGGGNFAIENVKEDRYILSVKLEGYNVYEQVVKLTKDIDLGMIYLVKVGAEGSGAALQKAIRATNIINLFNQRPNMLGGNMVFGIAPDAAKIEGNNYLDKKWNTASLLLYRDQKVLEGYRVRYNIVANQFELMEPESNNVSVMMGMRIQNLVWVDSAYKVPRYFVNGMDFLDEGSPISGFFEVLVDGELPLMRRTLAIFKESNYNTALMVGNRNHQIIKRNTYYYLKGKNVIEVPTNRKKLLALFGKKAESMEEFINGYSLPTREPGSLFQIFTHFNSQFDGFQPIMSQLVDEK